MTKPTTLSEIFHYTLNAKTIEPVPRVKCLEHVPRGLRNAPESPRYVRHAYPIIGGINSMARMAALVTQGNVLYRKFQGEFK